MYRDVLSDRERNNDSPFKIDGECRVPPSRDKQYLTVIKLSFSNNQEYFAFAWPSLKPQGP